jgi:hypothetical protein
MCFILFAVINKHNDKHINSFKGQQAISIPKAASTAILNMLLFYEVDIMKTQEI